MEDNELELCGNVSKEHRLSDKHNNEGLHKDYVLVTKPHTTDKVWAHFGLNGNKDGLPDSAEIENPICHHCHKTVSVKQSNTTILFTHLQDNHLEIYAELAATKKQTNQPILAQVIEQGKDHEISSKQTKELDYAVAYSMTKDGQPFYTIKKQDF